MNRTDRELLQAALAVIERSERPNSALIEEIADRLAEKLEAVGFEDWWEENGIEWEWTILEHDAKALWTTAQLSEQKRIISIIHQTCKDKDTLNKILEQI